MQYTNVMLSYEQLTVARIAISDKLFPEAQAKLRTVYVELTKAKHQLEQERERSW